MLWPRATWDFFNAYSIHFFSFLWNYLNIVKSNLIFSLIIFLLVIWSERITNRIYINPTLLYSDNKRTLPQIYCYEYLLTSNDVLLDFIFLSVSTLNILYVYILFYYNTILRCRNNRWTNLDLCPQIVLLLLSKCSKFCLRIVL